MLNFMYLHVFISYIYIYIYMKCQALSQALTLNRICSENVSFDLRSNELEEWLIKRNYNPRVVRK